MERKKESPIDLVWNHVRLYGRGYALASIASGAAALLSAWIGPTSLILLQVMAVLVGSWSGGLYPGFLAVFICLVVDCYFFFEPVGRFSIENPDSSLSFVLLLIVGVSIAVVNEMKKRAFATEDRRRKELQTLTSSIADAVIATNLEGRIVAMNPVAEDLTGWSQRDAFGRALGEVFQGRNLDDPLEANALTAEATLTNDGFGQIKPMLLISRSGHEVPVETNSAPIKDNGGLVTGAVFIFRNISERLKAERQQRTNEERFRALIKATAEVVWTTSSTGQVVNDSPTWRAFTGQTLEEFHGSGWVNALHADDRERTRLAWEQATKNRSLFEMEYRLQSAQGGYRWTKVRGVPVLNDHGEVLEWVGMNIDITHERLALESLKASEQRYELVAEASNDAIWDWDLETGQILWNIGLQRLFGYVPSEIDASINWWLNHIHDDDRERVRQSLEKVHQNGEERWDAEYHFERADGSFAYVYDRGRVVIQNGKAVRMVGSMLDLTEQKRTEQAMAERSRLADLRADVSECLSSTDSLEETLQTCVRSILERLLACSVRIWLRNEETGELELTTVNDDIEAGISDLPLMTHDRLPVQKIVDEGVPFSSNDVCTDLKIVDENDCRPVRAFAGYPLIIEGHSMGVIGVFTSGVISPATLKDLAPLADTIAQYIQRKRGEDTLQEREQQYRGIFEASNDAILIFDQEGQIVEANPFACQMHGYEYREFIGKSAADIIDKQSELELARFFERVKSGTPFFDQGIHVRQDGSPIHVEIQGSGLQYRGKPHLLTVVRDVTERRQAERQFLELTQESERQRRLYDTILSNALDQVYVFDLDHRFSYANQALLNMWGKSWEEAIGKNCRELGYPDWQVRKHSEELNQVILTKQPIRGEAPVTGTNGRRIYDYIFYPVLGLDGEVEAIAGTSRDVTDRKITENNLRQSEARFRQLADAMPQIVWTATPNGYIDYYNDRWYEFTGLDRNQHGEDSWNRIMHSEDVAHWKEVWNRSVDEGTAFDIEFRLYNRRTRSFEWYLGRAIPAQDEDGDVVRWFGTFTDINRQKRNEQISDFLAEASSSLVDYFSDESTMQEVARIAVPDFADWCSIDMLEQDGRGRRVALVHAEPDDNDLQMQLTELYPPEFDANSILYKTLKTSGAHLADQIHGDEPVSRLIQGDGWRKTQPQLIRSVLCVPLISRNRMLGAISFGMARSGRYFDTEDLQAAEDVASRFTVAMENTLLYDQLRATDRRKDEFLAMLAHELRNPLAPIRSGLDLLTLESKEDQPVLLVMKEQVEHLVRLVDDLLDVSRIMRGKIDLRKKTTELKEIVERAVEAVRWTFDEKQQTLTISVPEESLPVFVDPVRLVQVVSNLLNNASKYTDPGGTIDLKVEKAEDEVRVRVLDNGIGIEPELLPNVFDLFTQSSRALDRAQGGLGIGLTLVQNLVEMHRGSVSVFSDGPGLGSEFLFQLPLSKRRPATSSTVESADSDTGYRILVVDDNLGAAKLLTMLLGKLGPHVIEMAHDGRSALEKLDDFSPQMILLDIGLPEMDGYEVAMRIRSKPEFQETLLVALTGYGREEDRKRSKEAGFDEHLVKPPALDALKQLFHHSRLQTGQTDSETNAASESTEAAPSPGDEPSNENSDQE